MIRIEAAHLEWTSPVSRRLEHQQAITRLGDEMGRSLAAFALALRRPNVGEQEALLLLTSAPAGGRCGDEVEAWFCRVPPEGMIACQTSPN